MVDVSGGVPTILRPGAVTVEMLREAIRFVPDNAEYRFALAQVELTQGFVAELGPCEVIATGGLAEPIIPHSRTVQHYEPWLTLFGLRIIFDRNR